MIVKGHQQLDAARTVVTRAGLREQLIELWAAVFECELRAELAAEPRRETRPRMCRDAPDDAGCEVVDQEESTA